MFGFSVFLGSDLTDDTKEYISYMSSNGFSGIFTSMHIPEDDSSKYSERISSLGSLAREENLNLMVDISTKALSALGLDLAKNLEEIKEIGITGLRMDYGISMETIAMVSRELKVGLNASTLSDSDIIKLKQNNAKFSNMEFWHNYYPRLETGLDKSDFIEKNIWLKELGGKIVAFVPGDKKLRGPLFNGLPSLESHRFRHPLSASIELLNDCLVDEVYIGDERVHENTIEQFKLYKENQIIGLRADFFTEEYGELLEGTHTNRMDNARDVVRSQEARFKEIPHIKQFNTVERTVGTITLDNYLYGRYSGELQIVKNNLVADAKVNVMGKIRDNDLDLIKQISSGQKYQFIRKG